MQYEHEPITERALLTIESYCQAPVLRLLIQLYPVWVTLPLGSAREAIEDSIAAVLRNSVHASECLLSGKID